MIREYQRTQLEKAVVDLAALAHPLIAETLLAKRPAI
jgi:hypothetical protein